MFAVKQNLASKLYSRMNSFIQKGDTKKAAHYLSMINDWHYRKEKFNFSNLNLRHQFQLLYGVLRYRRSLNPAVTYFRKHGESKNFLDQFLSFLVSELGLKFDQSKLNLNPLRWDEFYSFFRLLHLLQQSRLEIPNRILRIKLLDKFNFIEIESYFYELTKSTASERVVSYQTWKARKRRVIFWGHHKCASRFFRFLVFQNISLGNSIPFISYNVANPPFHYSDPQDLDYYNIPWEKIKNQDEFVLALCNSGLSVVEKALKNIKDACSVRIIRDPRQIFVSNYFHHKEGHNISSNGWHWDLLDLNRPALQSLPQELGLLLELDNITKHVLDKQFMAFPSVENCLTIKLEDFISAPAAVLRSIENHIGSIFTIDEKELTHYGKNSSSQDWRKVMSPKIKSEFKNRYGRLLRELEYETDDNW